MSNILIIDDTPANLQFLTTTLTKQGYQIFSAISGKVALKVVQKSLPDLILLDINMPEMNGYEVCQHLKAASQTRDIPVIFVSALNETFDKVKAFSVGGVDYITKPFQEEELLARIKTHLNLRHLQKSLQKKNNLLEQEIIERKRAEEEAKVANQAKSTFLANMSHELRSPLNAILGFAKIIIRNQKLEPEDQENIGIISRSGEHLLALINQVLDLSKIEAGRATLNETHFDLYRLLSDLEDMFHLKADDKHLQLIFNCEPSVPQYIRTDEVKLRQVLINLLNNALKFTEDGGVTVHIDKKNLVSKPLLHFEVEDTGPGIAPDELDHVFEAFVQTSTGKQAQEGTGLGLPISRQFVQLMGGELMVSSKVGHGTVFKFNIPYEPAKASDIQKPKHKKQVIALEPNQPRYRILIVDDKWTNRQLLIKWLNPLGFDLKEAENGQEAIDIVDKWQPHLIWMDLRMPVMDGYEATRQIKAHTKGQAIAIIALTASVLEEERAIVLDAGCDDFLRKPFCETHIFELMTKHIGVRFIYEDSTDSVEPTQTARTTLNPAALSALPSELVANLKQATMEADITQIVTLIEQIRTLDVGIATALAALANDFKYDNILSLIQ